MNLQPHQTIISGDGKPSPALIEVMDRLVRRVSALEARLNAIAAVAAPTGGATTDTEARAAIAAILAAA